jgi:hypothetical protein
LFGFRLELGNDSSGIRMQARRSGFVTVKAAKAVHDRLCRQRDARNPKPRPSDTMQAICDGWLLLREQELEPNTLYNYAWLLGLIYPYVGRMRASRLSARMVENAYRDLEAAGYSRTSLRTLDLVLSKAFEEQLGRRLGTRKPRESDEERLCGRSPRPAGSVSMPVGIVSTRCGGCCSCPGYGAVSCVVCSAVTWNAIRAR